MAAAREEEDNRSRVRIRTRMSPPSLNERREALGSLSPLSRRRPLDDNLNQLKYEKSPEKSPAKARAAEQDALDAKTFEHLNIQTLLASASSKIVEQGTNNVTDTFGSR